MISAPVHLKAGERGGSDNGCSRARIWEEVLVLWLMKEMLVRALIDDQRRELRRKNLVSE